jgi:hypothetical protein
LKSGVRTRAPRNAPFREAAGEDQAASHFLLLQSANPLRP